MWFCGFTPGPLRRYRLLIASHVKPWAASSNKERADVANGICACPNHDSASDTGLLTVSPDLRIHRARVLEAALASHDELDRVFGIHGIRDILLVPAGASRPGPEFLTFHSLQVFRR